MKRIKGRGNATTSPSVASKSISMRVKAGFIHVYTSRVRAVWVLVALAIGVSAPLVAQVRLRSSVELAGTIDLSFAAEIMVAIGTMALATVTYLSNLQTRRFQAASVRPVLVPGAASDAGPDVFEVPALSHGAVLFIENAGVGPAQEVTLDIEAPVTDPANVVARDTSHSAPSSGPQAWRVVSRLHRPVILPGRRERWVIDSPASGAVAAEITDSTILADHQTLRIRLLCYDSTKARVESRPSVYSRTPPSVGRNLLAMWEQLE